MDKQKAELEALMEKRYKEVSFHSVNDIVTK